MPPSRVAAIARQALCAAAAISLCGLTLVDARLAQLEAPILGWNSFLFGDGTSKYGVPNTTEILGPDQLLDGFKQNLMPAGYSYFVIDGGWGLPTAVDEFGRAVASPVIYPDLQNGSFAEISHAIHAVGGRFGLWWMHGVSREAVARRLPVKGTKFTADEIIMGGQPRQLCEAKSDWGCGQADIPGAAIENVNFTSAAECCALCQRTPNCTAWSWNSGYKNKGCYPKFNCEQGRPNGGCTSGFLDSPRTPACSWTNPPLNFRLNTSHPGARAYYASLVELWEDWNLDLLKFDCIFGVNMHLEDIQLLSEVLTKSEHSFVLSLSPQGGHHADIQAVKNLSTFARITGDFHRNWHQTFSHFAAAANLANESGNGFFLDLDLLPFGMEMGFPPNEPPWTPGRGMPFWQPVRRTIVSLWAIASSPLQYSGDVRSGSVDAQGNRYWTKELSALLTNPDVIAAHQNVRAGRQVSASNSTIIWVSGCAVAPTTNEKEAPLISVCHYVAVFNVWCGEPRKADPPCPKPPWGNTTHRTSAQLAELGINTAEQLQVTDLWNRTRDYVLPVGAKTLVTETAHLDVTFLKIASGAKHAPIKSSTAMFKSDDGEYDNNGPGLSIGTAFKGCQKPCWLNDRSQNKTTQNLWPFQVEITVFEHDCKAPTGCKLSHAWTGGTWPGYHNSRLRYYVDLEPNASVDFPLGLGAGSSMLEDVSTAPFSAGDLFGWTGLRAKGGIFNTYQIPFVKSVRVTVELLTTQATGQRQHDPVGFWLILRGTEGGSDGSAARLAGGVLLPKSARLRTFENSARVVAGGSTLDLLRSTAERQQIAILMVSLAVSSNHTGLSFLEGCFRAYSGKNSALQLLSSGTEDFFLGTFYFESGKFANALAGATRLNSTNGVPVCTWRGTPSGEPTCSSPTGASFRRRHKHLLLF